MTIYLDEIIAVVLFGIVLMATFYAFGLFAVIALVISMALFSLVMLLVTGGLHVPLGQKRNKEKKEIEGSR